MVSILMNCYNCEKYLKEAIDSIYNQTYKDWEIVFIDNCSTDKSVEIAKSYDDKIKIYKTPKNIPLGAARNFGLKFCKGEYLAFLDTDDIWIENKLELQIKNIKDAKMCYTGVIFIDENGKEIKRELPKADDDVFSQNLKRYEISMQSVLLKNENISFDESLKHSPDFKLFMSIASKEKVCVLRKYLVKYRKFSNSLTSKNIKYWHIEMKKSLDEILNDELREKYKDEIKLAYGKISFYKYQYLLSQNRYKEAQKELSKIKFIDYRYLILYLATPFLAKKILKV